MKKIFFTILSAICFCGVAMAQKDNSGYEAHTYQHDGHIPDGIYEIVSSVNSNLCWDVENGSTGDGAAIQLYTRNHTAAQRFEVKMVKQVSASYNGVSYIHFFYTFKNINSGKYVDLDGGKLDNGIKIQQWGGEGGTSNENQMWEIDLSSNGTFWIKSARVDDGGYQPRVVPGTVNYGGSPNINQGAKFTSTYYGMTSFAFVAVDGQQIARLDPSATYRISFKTDPAKGVEVKDGGTGDGANIQLGTYSGKNYQKWKVEYLGDGLYALRAKHSDKYMHTSDGSVTGYTSNTNVNGITITTGNTNVHQWGGTGTNANWMIRPSDEEGFYHITNVSGRVMDSVSNQTGDGTNIQGHRPNATDAEKFEIVEVFDDEEQVPLIVDGLYSIRPAYNPEVALDVNGKSNDNGANVALYTYSETAKNQQWIINHLGQGYHTIRAHHSKKGLDVDGGVSERGRNVQQWDANTSAAQKWHFRIAEIKADGTRYYYIVNSMGLYLDAASGTLKSGDNIQIWTPNYGQAQKWLIEPCVINKMVSDAQYATMWYEDLDLKVPAGFEAFSVKLTSNETSVVPVKTYAAGTTIPKGEAVVVHKLANDIAEGAKPTFEFPVMIDGSSNLPTTAGNCLRSSNEDIDVNVTDDAAYVYRLIKGSKGVGFYMTIAKDGHTEGKYLRSKGHLCYLFAKYKSQVMTKSAPMFVPLNEQ